MIHTELVQDALALLLDCEPNALDGEVTDIEIENRSLASIGVLRHVLASKVSGYSSGTHLVQSMASLC
jgi:hypothetical protein